METTLLDGLQVPGEETGKKNWKKKHASVFGGEGVGVQLEYPVGVILSTRGKLSSSEGLL